MNIVSIQLDGCQGDSLKQQVLSDANKALLLGRKSQQGGWGLLKPKQVYIKTIESKLLRI